MVNCCVPVCTKYLTKTSKTAYISYHKFPSDKQRRNTWLERIRRPNMTPMQYSYVCSDQFFPSCLEVNIRSQITEQKRKCRLKEDTVPSEFGYGREAKRQKKHDYQANIALNDEDMKEFLFYNISCFDFRCLNMSRCPI